ncbi:MAG: universal stress protein, partial [Limisphaerales bacterium]
MKSEKMKIICGTDFSAAAAQASTAAAAIAIKAKEPLLLVHVLETPAGEFLGKEVIDSIIGKGSSKLKEEADRLRALGAKVEEHFAVGSAYETLIDLVRQTRTRMVVLGSTKRSAPARWFIGSVAERVAQSAPA